MSITETLKTPLTMSKFLTVGDLAKQALAERAEAATALEALENRVLELECIAATLEEGSTPKLHLDALILEMKAVLGTPEAPDAQAA